MKVRVRDIAAKAGVSPATVSNALNGRAGVSKNIASQILRLAENMGYL
ncbi:MAG: helix-turn-helix domain-containing protein, partial [Clostridia bacterium]